MRARSERPKATKTNCVTSKRSVRRQGNEIGEGPQGHEHHTNSNPSMREQPPHPFSIFRFGFYFTLFDPKIAAFFCVKMFSIEKGCS